MLLPATPASRLAPPLPCPPCTLDCANTRIRPLQRLVRRGQDALQATLADADRDLPAFVTREVGHALSCGDPIGGFGQLACPQGQYHQFVPFSVQTRGFCPSCGGRQMVERALHWTEELLARVAVRQVVLLGRVFAVNGLACPTCGKVMVLRAEVRRPGPEGRRR